MAKTKEETKKVETKKVQKKTVKKEKKVSTPKKSFIKEVKDELKKVKWPSKEDMLKYSIATLAFIVIFGLYFYGLDALFAWISSLVKGL
ncbi:preprotein translocase subunit SecE [bacterium]|nr:preprotein translocase subunit SecE [bacterium]MDY3757385.1 preprotein translocase subunit SecE [Bacilli bacterium]